MLPASHPAAAITQPTNTGTPRRGYSPREPNKLQGKPSSRGDLRRGGNQQATNTSNAAAIFPADNSNAGEAGTITGNHSGRGGGYYFCNS